ncbi:hypothetical protein MTQ13_07245 [Streptomyces sp. XM4011]|uniref:hypothetical protein n=1 Tax=Streptomyces TaxID=1883 RepID=UPI001FF7D21A|nr:hypothetical protein [Streptomyces sp. XM4011]MCK1814071.1 hypothetical protein [Streptomyces sp. XM4011]
MTTSDDREQRAVESLSELILDDHALTLARWYGMASSPNRTPAERRKIREYIDALEAIQLPGWQSQAEAA